MGLIKGTHHIALRGETDAQFQELLDFYHGILGMEIVRTWGEPGDLGAMVDTGDAMLELFSAGRTTEKTGNINHFALATDDVDACIEAARKAGYKIKIEPNDIVIGSVPPYPARIGFCIGPVGEEIEFFCVK